MLETGKAGESKTINPNYYVAHESVPTSDEIVDTPTILGEIRSINAEINEINEEMFAILQVLDTKADLPDGDFIKESSYVDFEKNIRAKLRQTRSMTYALRNILGV